MFTGATVGKSKEMVEENVFERMVRNVEFLSYVFKELKFTKLRRHNLEFPFKQERMDGKGKAEKQL